MPKHLLIVESPAKAKTINKYLGKDYTVLASYGHVRDLVPKEGSVDPEHHFRMRYELIEKNEKHVEAIAKAVSMVDTKDTLIIVTADHSHAINFNGYCGRGTPITGLCYEVDDNGIKHTGKPSVGLDGKPYTVGGYLNGAGSILHEDEATKQWSGARPDLTQEQATNPDYLQQALIPLPSETHSGEDVAVFATGPWSHLFRGVIEQNVIYHVMAKAVTAE